MSKKRWLWMVGSVCLCVWMLCLTALAAEYKEAPQLAELVKSGSLPPLEERLPENPKIVQPNEEIGQYGGVWRAGLRGGADTAWLTRTISYEYLVRWDIDFTKPVPNVAESIDIDADSSEFTFHLRKGMKWSDGEPFTADDILFYHEILCDPEITTAVVSWLKVNGEMVEVNKVDDYTVTFKFAGPNGMFLQRLATPEASLWTGTPKHVVSQYYEKYNLDAGQIAKEMGFETSAALMQSLMDAGRYRQAWPSIGPWRLTAPYKGDTTVLVAERNSYYWKVDPEGQQLPYIDKVVYSVGEDVETLVLKGIAGEIDMQDRHLNADVNKAVFYDNQEQGGYRFFATIPSSMNMVLIALNLTHTDPVKREIFQNKNFRIGLSYALNRQEIIDLVYVGQGIPYQAAPSPTSPFYNERLATQYTEYNVELANEYLDKAGYTERNADGFRLGPDGKPISFSVETITVYTDKSDALELISQYWQAVGIDMNVKIEDRSILYARKTANEHDAVCWGGDGGMDVVLEPRNYFPFSHESNYAELWQAWFNHATAPTPEEPPANVKKQMELYRQIQASSDTEVQTQLMKEILDIAADEFYQIGVCLPGEGYGIVNKNMRNVPEKMLSAWLYPHPGPTNPEQYFYKK